jgi:hypothetical protein
MVGGLQKYWNSRVRLLRKWSDKYWDPSKFYLSRRHVRGTPEFPDI